MTAMFTLLRRLAICLGLLAPAAWGAPAQLRFEQLGAELGLPQSSVTAMLQDSDGFMWFAGQGGLSRYDGYRFLTYKNNPADQHSMVDNSVQVLHQDRFGQMWVGTRGGVQRYNRREDNFTTFLAPRGTAPLDVVDIVSDSAGVLWLATRTGLVRFDQKAATASTLLASENVTSLAYDSEGGLWAGTGTGVAYLAPGAASVVRMPLDRRVQALAIGPDGALWVGTGKGLEVWQVAGAKAAQRRALGEAEGLGEAAITSIFRDRSGGMWVGTQNAGLQRWDAARGRFTSYLHRPGNAASLADNHVSSLFQDRSGILWVGTWFGGASRVDLNDGGFLQVIANVPGDPEGLSSNKVTGITGDGPDALWITTFGGGLNRLDQATGKVTVYRHRKGVPGSLNDDVLTCVARDAQGRLLVGSRNGGMSVFDPATGHFAARRFAAAGGDAMADFVQAILLDKSGMLWIASRGGLHRLDPRSDRVTTWRHNPADPDSLSDNYVWNMLEDSRGRLWVGTSNGLDLLDRATGRFTHVRHTPGKSGGLSHSRVSYLHEGPAGVLWVGTGGGLNRISTDAAGKLSLRAYLASDGLVNPAVDGILQDSAGHLWISTDGGIADFDPVRETFRHYTARDGMAESEYFVGAAYRAADGSMYFGSFNHGVTVLRPGAARGNAVAPEVKITDLQLYNTSVRGTQLPPGVTLDAPLEQARALVLPYDQAVVSLEFAALHFGDPRRNGYQYRLEGLDKDWVRTDAARRFATYTNLAPGRYTFRVKGSNKHGVWNEEGATLSITVTPPFWATWWFRLATLALLLSGAYAAYALRMRALVRQKDVLERQVAQRTSEVVHQKTRAEVAQKNISLLSELGRRITSKLDRGTIMVTVHRHVQALIEADAFVFGVIDPARRCIDFPYAAHGKQQVASYSVSLDQPGELAAWAVLHQREVFINDAACRPDGWQAADGPESQLYAPMLFNGRVIGVLGVLAARQNAFLPMHMDMLATLASYTAVAMDNAHTYEQLGHTLDELKHAQQQLVQGEKMAALGTLSAGVAHEINNPANYAHAGAQLLHADLEQFRHFLIDLAGSDADPAVIHSIDSQVGALMQQAEAITDGTARIRDLVRDLGTFARRDDGEKKQVRLGAGLRSTVQLVRTMYAQVAELRVELEADPPVMCRPAQLNQVFMNLIVNACQAMEDKQARVGDGTRGVLTVQSRVDACCLYIDFIDTGSGIDDSVAASIYDPFFTTKPTGAGVGLGLSISFGIVEDHQGSIEVRSVPGEGSCFTLRLPLAPE